MPRAVSAVKKMEAIRMMKSGVGQRDISRSTGLSRPYLRKMSRQIGHEFMINGIHIKGQICICANCGMFLRRPPSKVKRASNHFCDITCKQMFMGGQNNPNWKGGEASNTFSKWVQNQGDYKKWRERALDRANYTCEVTGVELPSEKLQVHHIRPKGELDFQGLALSDENALVVSKEAHDLIHRLIRDGVDFDDAVNQAREILTALNSETTED